LVLKTEVLGLLEKRTRLTDASQISKKEEMGRGVSEIESTTLTKKNLEESKGRETSSGGEKGVFVQGVISIRGGFKNAGRKKRPRGEENRGKI